MNVTYYGGFYDKETGTYSDTADGGLLPGAVFAGAQKDAGAAQSAYREDLRIAVTAAPETLDIAFSSSAVAQQMTKGAIYENLVYLKGDYTIGLELAESFTVKPIPRCMPTSCAGASNFTTDRNLKPMMRWTPSTAGSQSTVLRQPKAPAS